MKTHIFLLILILFNLKTHGQNSDGLLEEIFTADCLTELEDLIKEFDNHIIRKTSNSNLELAYNCFNNSLKDVENIEEYFRVLSPNEMYLDSIIADLSKNGCFNEVWIFEYGIDYKTKDTLSRMINLNINNNYFSLLRSMSKYDKAIEEYINCFQQSGSISPGMIANFNNLTSGFNFNMKVYRMVFAIHLTTIAYQEKYKN